MFDAYDTEILADIQRGVWRWHTVAVAFGYSDTPVEEIRKIPRCMIGAIRKVCDGQALTLSDDNVLCGGGSLYTRFAPMQERIPRFVSEQEHYKQTPEQVKMYVSRLGISLTEKPYLNLCVWISSLLR